MIETGNDDGMGASMGASVGSQATLFQYFQIKIISAIQLRARKGYLLIEIVQRPDADRLLTVVSYDRRG
jgi:hypothetical protein